jgi:hypothetical protein
VKNFCYRGRRIGADFRIEDTDSGEFVKGGLFFLARRAAARRKHREAVTTQAREDVGVFESSGVAPQGKRLSKGQFIVILHELIESVEADDSMEGSLAYQWGEEAGTYRVQAALRVGNSMGQGGMRLLRADV